jgi:hypothetical protein
MNKRIRFRDRIKKQLRPLAFVLASFGVLLACRSGKIVKEPLKAYSQTGNPKPVTGKWKDGKCWIEGNDTLVYSFRTGKEVEEKRYKTSGFLSSGEKVREIRCEVDNTYALTDKNIFILVGASKAYFGKGDFNLDHGRVGLGKYSDGLRGWFTYENDVWLLKKDKAKCVSLNGGKSREFSGRFNENTRIKAFSGLFLIVSPGEKVFLVTYNPKDGEVLEYKANPTYKGKVSFREDNKNLILSVGNEEIKIRMSEGKLILE